MIVICISLSLTLSLSLFILLLMEILHQFRIQPNPLAAPNFNIDTESPGTQSTLKLRGAQGMCVGRLLRGWLGSCRISIIHRSFILRTLTCRTGKNTVTLLWYLLINQLLLAGTFGITIITLCNAVYSAPPLQVVKSRSVFAPLLVAFSLSYPNEGDYTKDDNLRFQQLQPSFTSKTYGERWGASLALNPKPEALIPKP